MGWKISKNLNFKTMKLVSQIHNELINIVDRTTGDWEQCHIAIIKYLAANNLKPSNLLCDAITNSYLNSKKVPLRRLEEMLLNYCEYYPEETYDKFD